jgi:hypothetical protein
VISIHAQHNERAMVAIMIAIIEYSTI